MLLELMEKDSEARVIKRKGVNSSNGNWVFSTGFIIHVLSAFLFNYHSR